MSSLMSRTKAVEKNKRYAFIGVEALGILCTISVTPFLGVPLMALGGWLGYRWFQYRAKNGMRF